jgi:hypothetical protein
MFDHNLRLLSAIFSRGLAASPISTAASEGSCAGASGNAAKAFAAGSAPAFLSICPPPPGLFPLAGGFVACANQTKKGTAESRPGARFQQLLIRFRLHIPCPPPIRGTGEPRPTPPQTKGRGSFLAAARIGPRGFIFW